MRHQSEQDYDCEDRCRKGQPRALRLPQELREVRNYLGKPWKSFCGCFPQNSVVFAVSDSPSFS
jgi:hypothetical protein